MENELIVRMLKEFVVETNQKWIHPDICEKGATAIETLMVQNKKLKSALHGTCSVCEHNRTLMVNTPCQNCLWYSDGSGLKDNWQLREELSAPNSTPDKPLSLEILRGMGGKPYWPSPLCNRSVLTVSCQTRIQAGNRQIPCGKKRRFPGCNSGNMTPPDLFPISVHRAVEFLAVFGVYEAPRNSAIHGDAAACDPWYPKGSTPSSAQTCRRGDS